MQPLPKNSHQAIFTILHLCHSSTKQSVKASTKQQANILIKNALFSKVRLHHSPHSFFICTLGEQKRYTFRSFKQEVDNLAASLLELGFEKNDRFGVWLPNTSENVAMSFAASKLGIIKVTSYRKTRSLSITVIVGEYQSSICWT